MNEDNNREDSASCYASPFHARLALQIARASHLNARDYLEEATLLCGGGHFGRATSLALVGQEEHGRAVYFIAFALGTVADKPQARQQMFEQHRPKQAMSDTTRGSDAILRCDCVAPWIMRPLPSRVHPGRR